MWTERTYNLLKLYIFFGRKGLTESGFPCRFCVTKGRKWLRETDGRKQTAPCPRTACFIPDSGGCPFRLQEGPSGRRETLPERTREFPNDRRRPAPDSFFGGADKGPRTEPAPAPGRALPAGRPLPSASGPILPPPPPSRTGKEAIPPPLSAEKSEISIRLQRILSVSSPGAELARGDLHRLL